MPARRVLLVTLLITLVAVLAVGTAAAQSAGAFIDQVDARGYATGDGVDVDVNELEDLARDLADDDLALVLLATEWPGGNDLLAEEVVQLAEDEWTVLVLSPLADDQLDVGAVSATVDTDAIDAAFDAAFDQPSRDPIVFARVFADGLDGSGASGGGGAGFLVVLLVIVVVVAVGWWLLSRRGKERSTRRIEDAKAELRDDIAGVANDILQLGDRADVAASDEAQDHFQTANAIYLRVDRALPDAATFDAVDDLDDELELAAWHLDTAEAIVDGTPKPEKPDFDEPWEGDGRPAAQTLPNPPPVEAPRPRPRPRPAPRRSSGGGGGLGTAILGGMLGSVLSGGGGRGRSRGGLRTVPRSRRSSGRRASSRRRSTPRRSSRGRGRRRG